MTHIQAFDDGHTCKDEPWCYICDQIVEQANDEPVDLSNTTAHDRRPFQLGDT